MVLKVNYIPACFDSVPITSSLPWMNLELPDGIIPCDAVVFAEFEIAAI